MIKRCKCCGKMNFSETYKNFDLVNDLQWLKQTSKVKQIEQSSTTIEDKKENVTHI